MAQIARTVGVDTGGTFTDLVSIDGDEVRFEKVASTPHAPERAIVDGLARLAVDLADRANPTHVVHGATVALNALLTGAVARAALVTNAGFADLIEIGRQDRPELYALHPQKPPALVPRERRFEIEQRSWPAPDGGASAIVEVRRPTRAELERLRRAVAREKPEAVAICLLHSYADPSIEDRVARALASLDIPITTSSGLLREHREYERFSTAVVNAALTPLVRGYLERLGAALSGARLSMLRSSGGRISAARAAVEPVRILLSGPAGGVLGAARAAREAGFDRMVGLDIGGTSADVAFRSLREGEGEPVRVAHLAGHPIGAPTLDIHTIGCGGGSLLTVDRGGVLRVGPQSAGADPGPVCYGAGDTPTITDAHVLLGHVAPGEFLGGRLELDVDAVERAFEKLSKRMGLEPRAAARVALDVANASMQRALGVMTMQRGEDPRETPLVAFGGAGGLHAAELARTLEMPCAIVPRGPGVLSALGMATADAVAEDSQSVLTPLSRLRAAELRSLVARLRAGVQRELREDGHAARSMEFETHFELRYEGQSFELRVAPCKTLAETARAFHRSHERLYGYAIADAEIELVNVAVRGSVRRIETAARARRSRASGASKIDGARIATRAMWCSNGGRARKVSATIYRREALAVGALVAGPAVLEEFSGATVVPPRFSARVVRGGHLVLTENR